jgi:hypothetical protein
MGSSPHTDKTRNPEPAKFFATVSGNARRHPPPANYAIWGMALILRIINNASQQQKNKFIENFTNQCAEKFKL